MRKDLLLGAALILVTSLGIGAGVLLPFWLGPEDDGTTIKPTPEPIAAMPKKEEQVKVPPPVERLLEKPKLEAVPNTPEKRVAELIPAPPEKKVAARVESPPRVEEPKHVAKIEPKVEVKKEAPRVVAAKIIVLDNLTKLNDPGGEFAVKSLNAGKEIVLLGIIKTLRIADVNERSVLDATLLEAHEIVFTGNINGGAKVLLGKARTLKINDINDHSMLDASALHADTIQVNGAINGNSTLKLHAPGGAIEFLADVNDRSQIDILAPAGKVTFKGRGGAIINGGAQIRIEVKDLDLRGAVNGPQTELDITLTKGGSLKFERLSGGVRLEYRKADDADPELRLVAGPIDPRAELRKLPALKR